MALNGAVSSIVGRKLNVLRSFPHPYQAHLGVFTLYTHPSEHTHRLNHPPQDTNTPVMTFHLYTQALQANQRKDKNILYCTWGML